MKVDSHSFHPAAPPCDQDFRGGRALSGALPGAAASDCELLHKAASAAGLVDVHPEWNPLTDDGDALRLAAELHINVEHLRTLGTMRFAEISASPFGRGDCLAIEPTRFDPSSAMRRAIVRAAAALGGDA